MPEPRLKPAITAAVRFNEISNGSAYRIGFAGSGRSGASFGALQGDLAAGKPLVLSTFRACMAAAGMSTSVIDSLVRRLSVHLVTCPLSQAERAAVDAALAGSPDQVDDMDQRLLADVFTGIDTCLSHAHAVERTLQDAAQLYFACWINMTGPPSTLLVWLDGGTVHLGGPVPPAPPDVSGAAAAEYLSATDYFTQNPGKMTHLDTAITVGLQAVGEDTDAMV